MRNKYGGNCYRCGLYVKPGDGHFERVIGVGWRVQHATCAIEYRNKKIEAGKELDKRMKFFETIGGTTNENV